MRSLLRCGLLVVCLSPLTVLAADPADKAVAIRYEQTVQRNNAKFKRANQHLQGVLSGLHSKKVPERDDAFLAVDFFEAVVENFRHSLKAETPPSGPAGQAYAKAVSDYLDHGAALVPEYYKFTETYEQKGATAEQQLAAAAPLLKAAAAWPAKAVAVGQARKEFLKAYEITPADLAQPAPIVASAPARSANDTAVRPPATDSTTETTESTQIATAAVPLTGPAGLHRAIKEGEKAFKDSLAAVQAKLIAKVALGDQIDEDTVEQSLSAIDKSIGTLESKLTTVDIPADPESKAYAASAKKLAAGLRRIDFNGLAKILTDKSLNSESRTALLTKKVGGLETAMKREFGTFEKARAAFLKKHKIEDNGADYSSGTETASTTETPSTNTETSTASTNTATTSTDTSTSTVQPAPSTDTTTTTTDTRTTTTDTTTTNTDTTSTDTTKTNTDTTTTNTDTTSTDTTKTNTDTTTPPPAPSTSTVPPMPMPKPSGK